MPFGLRVSPRRHHHRHHHHRPHRVVIEDDGPIPVQIIEEEIDRSRVRRSDILPAEELMHGVPQWSREEIRSVLRQLRDGTRIEDVHEIRTRGYDPHMAYRMLERSMMNTDILIQEDIEEEEVVTHVHSPRCSARRIRNEIAREHAHAHAAAHAHALDMAHERHYPRHFLDYEPMPPPMHHYISDVPHYPGVSYVPPIHAPVHRLL